MSATNPTITTIRSIGVVFARRKIRPLVWISGCMAFIAHALGVWLISQSAWWWLLETVFIAGTLVLLVLVISLYIALAKLSPRLTPAQWQAVRGFVDKLEGAAEHMQTPQIIIIYRVIRDIVRPRSRSFIQEVIDDSAGLPGSFNHLRQDLRS